MYLADIHIRNYRCFADERILFAPGVNVLLGENNGGKTTVISALSLVLDQGSRRRPQFFDFHHPPIDERVPPAITISVAFRSSDTDTVQDKALVATWLTKLDPPWEAQVTYTFMLEPDDHARCHHELSTIPAGDRVQYRRIVESFLDKYVAHTYGGNLDNRLVADRESLDKISLHSLDALRDAQRELFSGTNPLLKRLLRQVRDSGKTKEEQAAKAEEFITLATALGTHMHSRISLDPLLQLVTDTGALEGGKPHLKDNLGEDDVLAALRLHVENNGVSLPAELNGLGYNNLIYISLVLASLDHQADPAKRGTNAVLFPILCIEEPEVHLHPALQYKLLKHIEKRVRETERDRQVFITTHSTHITSASPLDQLICLAIPEDEQTPRAAYPGKCFPDDAQGKASKAYVERYLDATKSNLLFAKGIILVEGIAEQLLLPVLADHLGCSLEEHHVALIPVGGLTFRHFLSLFGARLAAEQAVYALRRPVACLVDADPTRQPNGPNAKFHKCYPYNAAAGWTYKPVSDVITTLTTLCAGRDNVTIAYDKKTLEYDVALHNHAQALLVTDSCTHAEALRLLFGDPAATPKALADQLATARAETAHLPTPEDRAAHIVATCYLSSLEDAKGEHALGLAKALNDAKGTPTLANFVVPPAIAKAIRWATRQPAPPQQLGDGAAA